VHHCPRGTQFIELSPKKEETDTQIEDCFLRQIRHALFIEFQTELANVPSQRQYCVGKKTSSTQITSTDNHSAHIHGVQMTEAMQLSKLSVDGTSFRLP